MTIDQKHVEFWNTQTTPCDKYAVDADFRDRYVTEIKRLYSGLTLSTVLDTGCGSGTMYEPFGFNRLTYRGVDFSSSMVRAFTEQWPDADVQVGDASSYVTEDRFDLIISINVVQYFTPAMLSRFLSNAKQMLTENGLIVIAGIPDIALQRAFDSGVLGPDRRKKTLLRRYRSYIKRAVPERMRKTLGLRDDGIGAWFRRTEFTELAETAGLTCEISPSVEYPYRFHAVLKHP